MFCRHLTELLLLYFRSELYKKKYQYYNECVHLIQDMIKRQFHSFKEFRPVLIGAIQKLKYFHSTQTRND